MTLHGVRLAPIVLGVALLLSSTSSAQTQSEDAWFGRDKALHFGASATLAVAGYGAGALFFEHPTARLATGAGLALTLGVAKELNDLAGHGDPSWRDLAWDVIGAGVGLALAWVVDVYVLGPWLRGGEAEPAGTSPLQLRRGPLKTARGGGLVFRF